MFHSLTGYNFLTIGDILVHQKENDALNEYILIMFAYSAVAYVKHMLNVKHVSTIVAHIAERVKQKSR